MSEIDWSRVNKKIKRFSLEDETKIGKCVHVYDGDTIQVVFPLQNELFRWTCRLSGVDTPEIRTRNNAEKQFGYDVRNYLREKILNKMIVIECGEFDKYGRLLGKIFLQEDHVIQTGGGVEEKSQQVQQEKQSINDWLIQNKYAFPYDGGKKQDWGKYLLEKHQDGGIH